MPKRKLFFRPDAVPQSLLQQLDTIRREQTKVESLDGLVHAAVWLYVDLVERLNLGVNGKLIPLLPEFSNAGPPHRRSAHKGSEGQGKVLSLLPSLDQEGGSSKET